MITKFSLGNIHVLHNHKGGREGVSQMLTFAYIKLVILVDLQVEIVLKSSVYCATIISRPVVLILLFIFLQKKNWKAWRVPIL